MKKLPLEDRIDLKIKEVAAFANLLAGVIVIHDSNWSLKWMSDRGLKELKVSLSELKSLSIKEYHSRFFNELDANDYLPKLIGLLERNSEEEGVTYFQQVRINEDEDWTWHMSCTKILMKDDINQPLLLITQSFLIDNVQETTLKASKLLDENQFLKQNIHRFKKLTLRELDILKCLAIGKSAIETGEELFISPQTVDTHKKNIKRKLETNSFYDLSRYARAFDLICLFLYIPIMEYL